MNWRTRTLVLAAALGCVDPDLGSSQDRITSGSFAATMASLHPIGWWRLGETSGATAADSSGRGHPATVHGLAAADRGIAGAIPGDPDGAVRIVPGSDCDDGGYLEVPDDDAWSLTKAEDGFARTVALGPGWGTADHGGDWTAEVSAGDHYDVGGGVARIHESAAGTWQLGLPVRRKNADVQVQASWSRAAAGGALAPVAIVARRVDAANDYRAELRENPGGRLDLRLVKVVAGASTVLATTTAVGTYAPGDWWILRFQLQGDSLRARAWSRSDVEPTVWQAEATDSAIRSSGGVSLRSSTSGTTSRPVVSFAGFRVQSLGLTVHAFLRPDTLDFTGETSANFVHWLGKGEPGAQEWALRLYPSSSTRPKRISAYLFGLAAATGAGAYVQDVDLAAGEWHEVVAVYDPGDALDTRASVSIYEDGACRLGGCTGATAPGTLYSGYAVTPGNGAAPLRIGTRDCRSFFSGALDEVAVFDRALTASEIAGLAP